MSSPKCNSGSSTIHHPPGGRRHRDQTVRPIVRQDVNSPSMSHGRSRPGMQRAREHFGHHVGRRVEHVLVGRLAMRPACRFRLDVHATRLPFDVQNRRAPGFGNTIPHSCGDASSMPSSRGLSRQASKSWPDKRIFPPGDMGFRGEHPFRFQGNVADFALHRRCVRLRARRSARKTAIGSWPVVKAVTEAQAPMSTTTRPLTFPFRMSAPNCGKSSRLAI